jgi:hypothetical protein
LIRGAKNRVALAPAPRASVILTIYSLLAKYAPMLAQVLSAAVNGIEPFPDEAVTGHFKTSQSGSNQNRPLWG